VYNKFTLVLIWIYITLYFLGGFLLFPRTHPHANTSCPSVSCSSWPLPFLTPESLPIVRMSVTNVKAFPFSRCAQDVLYNYLSSGPSSDWISGRQAL